MSVLFGLYQPDKGIIKRRKPVKINNPNDANTLGTAWFTSTQAFSNNFTVLQNIILGVEETKTASFAWMLPGKAGGASDRYVEGEDFRHYRWHAAAR